MKKTLAIFSPNEKTYSETFIQAHKNLPFNIKFYYDGWLPSKLELTGSLTRFSAWQKIKMKFNNHFGWDELALMNSLKKEKVDVVLAEYGPTACATLKVIRHLKLPLVVHFFGFDAGFKPTIEEYGEQYKLVFNYAKNVMVVSEKMRRDLINRGCPEHKIVLTYCGPDNVFLKARPQFNSQQFIAIGRFINKKAPYITIVAFKMVLEKFPASRLVMIGDGPLLETCKNLVRLWCMEKSVDFMGIKTPLEIFGLFENSVAFVQHSVITGDGDAEGTPVAVLDAQAAGLPVISTFHAGIADVIVHNETGLLTGELNVNGMAENMIMVLQEDGLAKKMGTAGRKRVLENFSLEKHLNILSETISGAIA